MSTQRRRAPEVTGDRSRAAKRIIVGLAGILLLVVALQSSRVRSVTLLVPSLGFVQAAPDVWVQRGSTAIEREQVLQTVVAARQRLGLFYPRSAGHPIVLACASRACYWWHGGIGPYATTFARRVLVSPAGVNVVKMSHEFSHVELAMRVGPVRALFAVPHWFDEGLAVLASADPEFGEVQWLAATGGGTKAPALDRLETLRGWLAATKVDKQMSYGTARHEVARWYARAGAVGLERLFTNVRDGESFRHAYSEAEGAAR